MWCLHNHPACLLSLWVSVISLRMCIGVSYSVLPPLPGSRRPEKAAVAMVMFPGYGIQAAGYKGYCRLVQSLYPIRLWVVLVDVPEEQPITSDNVASLVYGAQGELRTAGMDSDVDLFLAAHGDVGKIVSNYARDNEDSLKAVILLGAVLPREKGTSDTPLDFPLPVLSMVGELDGVTRLTRLAHTLTDTLSSYKFSTAQVSRMPLVVLEGSNHGLFTTVDLPDIVKEKDIESEGNQRLAIEDVAWKTALFMAHVVKEPLDYSYMAETEFQHAFEHVKRLTKPIRELQAMTQQEVKSYWVKSAQKWLSGIEGFNSAKFEADSYVVADGSGYMGTPPTIRKDQGIDYIITFSHVMKYVTERFGPLAPDEIAARMLGPGKLQQHLHAKSTYNYTCADLNYAAYMTAYHSSLNQGRKRYDSFSRGMTFKPDVVTDSSSAWESSRLKTEVIDGVMHVTSSSYQTLPSSTEYSGLYYCKLLPPDKALEWILVDSIRRGVPGRGAGYT